MGLEQLVRAMDLVTVPFRLPDRAVKLAYDAVSEWQENKGRDRFTLAQYSSVGIGAVISTTGIVLPFQGLSPAYSMLCLAGPVISYFYSLDASGMREDASRKGIEKTLDSTDEVRLDFWRIARFPLLLSSVYFTADVGKDPLNVLYIFGSFALASYCYFMDGNTSGYEKAKAFARNALLGVKYILPKRAQQPSPS